MKSKKLEYNKIQEIFPDFINKKSIDDIKFTYKKEKLENYIIIRVNKFILKQKRKYKKELTYKQRKKLEKIIKTKNKAYIKIKLKTRVKFNKRFEFKYNGIKILNKNNY